MVASGRQVGHQPDGFHLAAVVKGHYGFFEFPYGSESTCSRAACLSTLHCISMGFSCGVYGGRNTSRMFLICRLYEYSVTILDLSHEALSRISRLNLGLVLNNSCRNSMIDLQNDLEFCRFSILYPSVPKDTEQPYGLFGESLPDGVVPSMAGRHPYPAPCQIWKAASSHTITAWPC